MLGSRFFVTVATVFIVLGLSAEGKIMQKCDVVKELQKAGISKTFISNWVCLMITESGLDTSAKKGPGTAASYSYGILQISSLNNKYCVSGRKGGVCNQKCEDFLNDDIRDDIACANKIFTAEGFNYWKGWVQKCKNKPLPDVTNCKRRRRRSLFL